MVFIPVLSLMTWDLIPQILWLVSDDYIFLHCHFKINYHCIIGITVSGLERPLTVGKPANITCRINIPASSIVWRDQSSDVVANATDKRELVYHISTVTDDLHGQSYTCEVVSTADNETNTKSVEIQVVGRY